jgi:Galactose oxidase, central domain/Kelch motif
MRPAGGFRLPRHIRYTAFVLIFWIGLRALAGAQPSTAIPPPDGRMHQGRFGATATLMRNGQVLITGGVALDTTASPVAEVYDSARGGFLITGGLLTGRTYHTATLLDNGKVLIAGGIAADGRPVRASELYDPGEGGFDATGNMITPRFDHAATLLPNGKVLITGGDTTTALVTDISAAELFDPATGIFNPTGEIKRYYDPEANIFWKQGSMNAIRAQHTATLLRDGQVLIAGGGDATGTAQALAELYDPATGKFTTVAPMNSTRKEHRAVLLANGDVLIVGGVDAAGRVLASAELFNPSTNRFTLTTTAFPGTGGNMSAPRYGNSATVLNDGRALIAGGSNAGDILNTAELYDPARGSFVCVAGPASSSASAGCNPSMIKPRDLASAAMLPDGEVLLAGGYDRATILNAAEIYNPQSGSFASVADLLKARAGQ